MKNQHLVHFLFNTINHSLNIKRYLKYITVGKVAAKLIADLFQSTIFFKTGTTGKIKKLCSLKQASLKESTKKKNICVFTVVIQAKMVTLFDKNEAKTFFLVLLFFREVVIAPVLCYLLYNFWKYQKLDFIYRRRPLATIVLSACTIVEIGVYLFFHRQKKMVLPFCRYNLMFGNDPTGQKVYDWFSLSVLIHETMLIPRFWFLYYDWQLGKDLSKLAWKQQLYLGRLRVHELSKNNVASHFVSDHNSNNVSDAKTNTNTDTNTKLGIESTSEAEHEVEVEVGTPDSNKPFTTEAMPSLGSLSATTGISTYPSVNRRDSSGDDDSNTRWTLRYRRYLGNTKFVLIVLTLYFCVFFSIAAVLQFSAYYHDTGLLATSYSLFTSIIVLICGFKITKCHDVFEIQSYY
ncbi:hypothetical protein RFI_09359 [Reticulomyxa filosa]|uniref:Uncharacterized protein n=1 Tax=Reticulomyxa filosa TaxID=46433 RepID=X6NQZ1_RETFI|nr:hypothetical protein RFI_09359 [Reticulomyxa filosa]|eukprot:ETO27772.1 hypothetical protein RFI_09359 [Reticulomyxa filosa]